MDKALPELFFRIRDNGAVVFRVSDSTRNRRLEFEQIAVVNVRSGDVKPHGDRTLSARDIETIEAWLAERRADLAARERLDVQLCVEQINRTAQWAQSRADADALADVTDTLLLAMHDLRTVLLRKKADRIGAETPPSKTES